MNPVQNILILLVRLYRMTLSPLKTFLFGPAAHCRFEPTCSQYAIEALKTHGAVAGGWLAAKRVCRCHPWGKCGEDPVPPARFNVQRSKVKVPSPKSTAERWIKSPISGCFTSLTKEFHLPKGEGQGEGKTSSMTQRCDVSGSSRTESFRLTSEFNPGSSKVHA